MDTPLKIAVRVAVSVDVTAEAVAVKPAVREPDATVTLAGTLTAELLLDRVTTWPPEDAGALRVTVQASVAAPVMVAAVQPMELSVPGDASPVPLRLMRTVPLVAALLLTVMEPVAAPDEVGSKVTCSVVDCPGLSVTGKVAPDMVKPVPVNAAELIVTAEVPDEVRVTDSAVGVLRFTSPKARELVLTLRAGATTSSCSA